MKTNVECVSPETSVREAACRMRDQNIGFLPVCDEDERVMGAVTDRDIALRIVAEGESSDTPVQSVMCMQVVACRSEDDLAYARRLMAHHRKSRIMCVDAEGRLEGVISLSDIAQIDEQAGAATLREVSGREARSARPH
jgi:CBS domain-containing protein